MMMLVLLPLRRSLHVLALRRLPITCNRIRWTGLLLLSLLLLLMIVRLLGHALIMRLRSMRLKLAKRVMLTIILLIALRRRRGLTTRSLTTSSSAGPVVGLGLIARRQTPAGSTEAAALIQRIVATILVVVVDVIFLLAALVVVAVIPPDDALTLRFCGDGTDAAVVLTRLRVISPSSSASTGGVLLPIAPRDRWGGLVHHPGDVAAHGWWIRVCTRNVPR